MFSLLVSTRALSFSLNYYKTFTSTRAVFKILVLDYFKEDAIIFVLIYVDKTDCWCL